MDEHEGWYQHEYPFYDQNFELTFWLGINLRYGGICKGSHFLVAEVAENILSQFKIRFHNFMRNT